MFIGHLVLQRWIFGGVEVGTKGTKCFMVHVHDRTADTLLSLIQEYILPGTEIISDGWPAYFRINQLPEQYTHLVVNHSENYVDPDTGACTNHIESEWQKLKMENKKRYGTQSTVFESYFSEYIWRKMFKGPDTMFHLWSQISMLDSYKVE